MRSFKHTEETQSFLYLRFISGVIKTGQGEVNKRQACTFYLTFLWDTGLPRKEVEQIGPTKRDKLWSQEEKGKALEISKG